MLNSLHCRRVITAGLVISLLMLTVTVLAVDTTLTGTVTTDDTAFTDCDTNYGKIMPFWVTQTGTYTLDSAAPPFNIATDNYFFVFIMSSLEPRISVTASLAAIDNTFSFRTDSVSLTAGTTYYLIVSGDRSCVSSVYPLSYSFRVNGPGAFVNGPAPIPEDTPVPPDSFQPLRDGRINGADHAAPVAVYPVDYGSGQVGLHVYDTATGVLLLEVTPAQIAATDGVSAHTLIAEGAGVVVYRLADGTFYVGAPMANGKQYTLTFDQLSATTAHSSTEVE